MGMVLRSLARPEMLGSLIEREWPLQVGRVRLVRSLANDVYRVEPGHFLKVYRHGWRTADEVAWEADLIAHLAGSGIPVAAVAPRRDGSAVGIWRAPEGPRPLLLFQAIPGRPPEPPFAPGVHRKHGELIARVHQAGRAFRSPHPRRSQDPVDRLEERLGELLPVLTSARRAMANRVVAAALAALASTPPTRGVCHGDATLDNVLVTGGTDHAPQLALIDFDLSGPGMLPADFPWGIDNWDHFLAGYTSVRPSSPAELATGPAITAANVIAGLHFHLIIKPRWRGEESAREGWAGELLDELHAVDLRLGQPPQHAPPNVGLPAKS
jgi:Ser/Thr protein kinase RdoA (MazF antagonist)